MDNGFDLQGAGHVQFAYRDLVSVQLPRPVVSKSNRLPFMLPQLVLYLATVVGAAALYLLMPKPGRDLRVLGGLLGAATLGALWLVLVPLTLLKTSGGGASLNTGFGGAEAPFYYAFSAIAIGAGVRVITHTRPVYAALWFVMVIIASAGLMLTLSAEFMALAMIIIYGGAILVTYMFVIMLATPPQAEDEDGLTPDYDRYAVEPIWASAAGFLLLAVILSVVFMPMRPNLDAAMLSDAELQASTFNARHFVSESLYATPTGLMTASDTAEGTEGEKATPSYVVRNVEHVGLDLFQRHPLAIELAGIILLLALVGAVVIAKTQVPEAEEPENSSENNSQDVDPSRANAQPSIPDAPS